MAPSSDRESMDLETLRQKAKKAYLEGDYHNSLKLNQQLHATAIAQQVFKYQVLGLRFIGLCYYRLDDLGKSETNLQKALDLIANDDTADNSRQRLLITNHLCATIRRQGKYDEADKLFRTSLEEATLPHHLNERCRLMGNYGALLDELGQRARADDCYARFEELAELDDKPGRLANARGLAARSAELRGDTDTARKKYEDEKRLAEKAGDKLRILAASIHAARQLPAKESVARLEEILADDSSKISQSRQIDAHLAIAAAQFRLAKEHEPTALSSSWYHTNKVLNLAGTSHEGNDSHWEKRANALEQMARVCQRAGLHGEAFYYFEKVVNLRYEKYRPLEANKRIRSMAQSRLETLKDLAAMMVDEAHQVDRDREQRNTLNKLLKHVYGEKKPPQSQVSEKYIDVWTWADTERKKAKERWKELMASDFKLLSKHSQSDLIKSEFSYSARVDDLARSAHLLATVVERELKNRLLTGYRPRVSFGDLVNALAGNSNAPSRLKDHLKNTDLYLAPLARLAEQIKPLEGDSFKIVKVRNAIAHGSERDEFPKFDRLAFDALKRFLAVMQPKPGQPTLLGFIANLPRPT